MSMCLNITRGARVNSRAWSAGRGGETVYGNLAIRGKPPSDPKSGHCFNCGRLSKDSSKAPAGTDASRTAANPFLHLSSSPAPLRSFKAFSSLEIACAFVI